MAKFDLPEENMEIDFNTFFDAATCLRLNQRLREVMSDIRTYGIHLHKGRQVLTGYSYGEFYDWDLYFENLFLTYYGISDYNRNWVEMFLDQQLECGFVSRTMGVSWQKPRHHFKPFLAQIALLGSRQTGDYRWLLGKYYQRLKKYLDYWFWFCDYDKNGLCVWDGSDHSGMDNQARRCGYDGVMTVEGVDLNSYLVRELQAMGEIAAETGRLDEAESFRNQAEKLSRLINDVFWDEVDGFYYDRDERQNELVKIKSIAGLIPLWAGIAPEDRASRLVEEHILNPSEFWLPYPLATWARNEPDYYQERRGSECTWMGATWVPTNYMVFHGLLQYGYKDVARELADKTFRMVLQESATREYYNGETGSGQGLNPFWGWSTLAYLMPVEYQLGYDPTDLTRRDFLKIKKA
jgi:putative isomerase